MTLCVELVLDSTARSYQMRTRATFFLFLDVFSQITRQARHEVQENAFIYENTEKPWHPQPQRL